MRVPLRPPHNWHFEDMTAEETRRRIRAARALADLTVEELASAIDTKGLGPKTLGAIERGERAARAHELRAVAIACALPYEFFTADLADVFSAPHHGSSEVTEMQQRLERLEQTVSHELLRRAAGEVERGADTPDTPEADKPARLPADP